MAHSSRPSEKAKPKTSKPTSSVVGGWVTGVSGEGTTWNITYKINPKYKVGQHVVLKQRLSQRLANYLRKLIRRIKNATRTH